MHTTQPSKILADANGLAFVDANALMSAIKY